MTLAEFIQNFTTNEYLVAFIYLVIFFAGIRIAVFILERVTLKLTLKTKTDLDDLIVEKLNKPLTFIALLFGLKISIEKLSVLENSLLVIQNVISSLVLLVIIYSVYTVFDLSFKRIWKKFAKKTSKKSHDALMHLTQGAVKVLLILTAIIYLLSIWGVEVGPLLAGLGIGGIAIAFALQSSLANIFGGISMILDRSINVGDVVNLEGVSGTIMSIGLRSTRVKTYDNEIVIVPNSKLADGNIHNVAQPNPIVRVVIPFGVAYGSDVDKVKKLVLNEIKKVANIVEDPAPYVKFLEMADSSLNFKAYFFVDSFNVRLSAKDEANTRIYKALNKAGIEIPFPQMDVNLKK